MGTEYEMRASVFRLSSEWVVGESIHDADHRPPPESSFFFVLLFDTLLVCSLCSFFSTPPTRQKGCRYIVLRGYCTAKHCSA